jgi:hypothetical protein
VKICQQQEFGGTGRLDQNGLGGEPWRVEHTCRKSMRQVFSGG